MSRLMHVLYSLEHTGSVGCVEVIELLEFVLCLVVHGMKLSTCETCVDSKSVRILPWLSSDIREVFDVLCH